MKNSEAAQNTLFYQVLKEEARKNESLHQEMVRQFRANPQDKDLQSTLQVSKLYVSAYLTLLNKCKDKKLNHTPRNLTLMFDMLDYVEEIEERIKFHVLQENEAIQKILVTV